MERRRRKPRKARRFSRFTMREDLEYEVFLSFRGGDTRSSFVSHLYKELTNKGIYTFKDDIALARGNEISTRILASIRRSKISLVVLSKNYADSSWCLNELEIIIQSADASGQIVVPIFYKVDPTDMADLGGSFARAFEDHEKTVDKEKLERWKEALSKLASIAGWDSRWFRDEAALIETVVRDVSDKLVCVSSPDVRYLVGMGFQVNETLEQLRVESNAVRMVGIWGMGGIGKTTFAKIVFDTLSKEFQSCCFLWDVKDKFKKSGPAALQAELLSKILLERNLDTWPLGIGSSMIKERLCHKKVLIVLDDIDKVEQLEALAGELNWFGPGSRILITTRDKHVLREHGVDFILEREYMQNDRALQLFSLRAFKLNQPRKGFNELSKSFVSYAKGLPLALRVLGSFLCNRDALFWQSTLEKLKKIPNPTIQNVLKISYDGLDHIEKQVFLDIACFFNGRKENLVRNFLGGCGFFPDSTLQILVDKALITVSDETISTHDLLRDMGHDIVRQESEEVGRRSRLWDPADIFLVLTKYKVTKKVEGIILDTSKVSEVVLNSKAFKRMNRLRLLEFYDSKMTGNTSNVGLPVEGLQFLSHELRYLYWHAYPLMSLPSSFSAKELVELHLPHSNIEQISSGNLDFENLRVLDLSHTPLITISGLLTAQKLESLKLEGCRNLVEVSSIQHLTKLVDINLANCENLQIFPSISGLKFLTTLNLSNCSKLSELPQSLASLSGLKELDIKNCRMLENLPIDIRKLGSSEFLNIAGCSNLLKLVEAPILGSDHIPAELQPQGDGLPLDYEEIPIESEGQREEYSACSQDIPLKLQHLEMFTGDAANGLSSREPLQSMASSSFSRKLEQTSLGYLNPANGMMADLSCIQLTRIPELSMAQRHGDLNLRQCIYEADLSSTQSLKMLKILYLSGCSNIKKLPSLPPKIESLYLAGTAIEELPQSVGNSSCLVNLDLGNCSRLMALPSGIHRLNSLQIVNVAGCSNLLELLGRIGKGKQPTTLCLEGTANSREVGAVNQEGYGTRENEQKKMEESIPIVECKMKGKKLKRSARLRKNPSIQSGRSGCSELRSLPGWSISEVMADLYTHEELKVNRRLFLFATHLFEQEGKREMYMSLNNAEEKIEWLKFQHDIENEPRATFSLGWWRTIFWTLCRTLCSVRCFGWLKLLFYL